MYKNIVFVCIYLLAFSTQAQMQSLEVLIKNAQKNQPNDAQIALIKDAAILQQKLLSGQYLPQVNLGGQASWQSDVTSLPISLPNVNILPPPQDQYKVTLDINQNIYDGGLTKIQKKLAEANSQTEQLKIVSDLQQVAEQVSQFYFGILLAKRQSQNAQTLLSEIDKKISTTEVAVANGVSIKNNLLQLKAKKIELENQLTELNTREKSAKEALELLCGHSIDTETLVLPPAETLQNFESKRPELDLLNAQINGLMINQEIVKAKNRPKVALFATGGLGRPGLNFLARDFQPYFIGGASLKIPLSQFYNGSINDEIQQNKINQQRIEKQKENFLLMSDLKVQAQKNEIERLNKVIFRDGKLINIRSEIRLTADAQLSNGVITATDYLSAFNDEEVARQTGALHAIQLLQAQQNLKLLLGY